MVPFFVIQSGRAPINNTTKVQTTIQMLTIVREQAARFEGDRYVWCQIYNLVSSMKQFRPDNSFMKRYVDLRPCVDSRRNHMVTGGNINAKFANGPSIKRAVLVLDSNSYVAFQYGKCVLYVAFFLER